MREPVMLLLHTAPPRTLWRCGDTYAFRAPLVGWPPSAALLERRPRPRATVNASSLGRTRVRRNLILQRQQPFWVPSLTLFANLFPPRLLGKLILVSRPLS